MPKASEIAIELRKVADALDLNPDVENTKPSLSFYYFTGEKDKDKFLATARILPRPVAKEYPDDNSDYSRVRVTHDTAALSVETSIYRVAICTLIEPAKPAVYDCGLTLLDHEDAALTENVTEGVASALEDLGLVKDGALNISAL